MCLSISGTILTIFLMCPSNLCINYLLLCNFQVFISPYVCPVTIYEYSFININEEIQLSLLANFSI